MRIYVNGLNLELLETIAETFNDYLVSKTDYIDVYTTDGIYCVKKDKTEFLDSLDKDIRIFENYYKNFTLIIDDSTFRRENVTRILGFTHMSFEIEEKKYKLDKNSQVTLVLKRQTNNIPYDIYFETNKTIDINDLFIKKEIIEFLSVLN